MVNSFWKKYVLSDELEQSKLLDELPLFQNKSKNGFFLKCVTKTMIKSYFDDIIKFFEEDK